MPDLLEPLNRLYNDAFSMALRLYGESPDTFSYETAYTMDRWRIHCDNAFHGKIPIRLTDDSLHVHYDLDTDEFGHIVHRVKQFDQLLAAAKQVLWEIQTASERPISLGARWALREAVASAEMSQQPSELDSVAPAQTSSIQ